jgi:hypothetical protein
MVQQAYKLMIGCSMLILSAALLIFSLKTNNAYAGETKRPVPNVINHPQGVHLIGTGNGIYEVRWDQLSSKYEVKNINDITY